MTRFKMAVVVLCVLVGVAVPVAVTTVAQADGKTAPQVRVGTFDSRAVAFAYARSSMFEEWLKGLQEASSQAEKAGDVERVKELEKEAQAEHALRGKQVFSTFPAYDVLARIKADIPKIAAEAGVDVIVSKWEIVYQRPGVEFVDVTGLMVQLFHLDEDAQQNLKELLQQEPVPLSEFGEHE